MGRYETCDPLPKSLSGQRADRGQAVQGAAGGLGFETVVCLPFSREGYDDQLGVPIRQLQQEIKRADMLIAFGGDGTILHLARTVALHNVPVLGINLGSLGFMSELGSQRAGTAA